MSEDKEPTARELIEAMRGGVPVKCDFCGKEVPDFCMEPEEGGMWACIWCLYRWEATENREKFKRISELEAELKAAKEREGEAFEASREREIGTAKSRFTGEEVQVNTWRYLTFDDYCTREEKQE